MITFRWARTPPIATATCPVRTSTISADTSPGSPHPNASTPDSAGVGCLAGRAQRSGCLPLLVMPV
jgi:hypothetical protein